MALQPKKSRYFQKNNWCLNSFTFLTHTLQLLSCGPTFITVIIIINSKMIMNPSMAWTSFHITICSLLNHILLTSPLLPAMLIPLRRTTSRTLCPITPLTIQTSPQNRKISRICPNIMLRLFNDPISVPTNVMNIMMHPSRRIHNRLLQIII